LESGLTNWRARARGCVVSCGWRTRGGHHRRNLV
jgi:hypothetical protein